MIRIAETAADMDAVYRLTHDEYVRKGYCLPQPDGRLVHYPYLDNIPETIVLLYEQAGVLVGTNSVTRDSEAHGLHTDRDFMKEMFQIRMDVPRTQLVGTWRIVVKRGCSAHVALDLMNETLRVAERLHVRVGVATFHPDHAKFYRKLFGMQAIAFVPRTHGLMNAPAMLMRWDRPSEE